VAARLDEGAAVLLERDAIAALRLALFARRRGLDERLAELLGERLVAAGSFQECPARLGAVIVVPGLPRLREELARVTRVDTPLGVAALDRLLGIHENSEVRAL